MLAQGIPGQGISSAVIGDDFGARQEADERPLWQIDVPAEEK